MSYTVSIISFICFILDKLWLCLLTCFLYILADLIIFSSCIAIFLVLFKGSHHLGVKSKEQRLVSSQSSGLCYRVNRPIYMWTVVSVNEHYASPTRCVGLVRTTDRGQVTGKLYHLRLRVECILFVIYKTGREPTPYW
jgi:hypothetical protein